ncbi:MAG: hypothetical protein FH751_11180 [Firmicutes bacterium]|nr:hypothetical protein [Bacillota bacterium]
MLNKKIVSILIIILILFATSSSYCANLVVDNSSYYKPYGYTINSYETKNTDIKQSENTITKKDTEINKDTAINEDTSSVENTKDKSNNRSNEVTITTNNYNPSSYGTVINNTKSFNTSNIVTINNNTNNNNSAVIKNTKDTTKVTDPTTKITDDNFDISDKEKILFNLINEEREKRGLNPLILDKTLFKIAEIKSQDMHDNNYFSHVSPNFGKTSTLLRKEGINYFSYGENIGWTYSVYRAHNGFMESDGHRANILNPSFTHIGIGIVGSQYTELFIKK